LSAREREIENLSVREDIKIASKR
jgi:hypothetical protein